MDNAKAIKAYRKRRIQRLRARYDVKEEENNGGGKGGHGNTKIPFGLCQREGITVDPKWTPKDAWNALEGKGYSAKESYEKLRSTGSIPKKTGGAKTKRQHVNREKLIPSMMKGGGKSKLNAFDAEFSKMDVEEHVSDLLSNMGSIANGPGCPSDVKFTTSGASSCDHVTTKTNPFTGEVVKAIVSVPQIDKVPDFYKETAACSYAHEMVHLLNRCQSEKGVRRFTDNDPELDAALVNARNNIGSNVKSMLQKASDDWKEAGSKLTDETNAELRELNSAYNDDRISYDEYSKAYDKARKEYKENYHQKMYSFQDGVATLSNLYDAISGGRLYDSGVCFAGHGTSDVGSRGAAKDELLSIYVELHLRSNKKLLETFRQDQPELAKALDNSINRMLKKSGLR